MAFASLARCAVAGGILLSTLLSVSVKDRLSDSGASLVDVTAGALHDGWGNAAVETLPIYYPAETGQEAIEMLGFRPSFLPVFDWSNRRIETAVASDLYSFFASGAGTSRVQYGEDPTYAFRYATRYQEPAGRLNVQAGEGYALGFGAGQSRLMTSDNQNWSDASLGLASGIASAGLETEFNTSSSSGGFGANMTTFTQAVVDSRALTRLSRRAWQVPEESITALWSGRQASFNSDLPSSLSPPVGVSGPVTAISQRLLGNYFTGGAGQQAFARSAIAVDRLGQ
jgi:hypothetical protein